ncbi:MAG: Nif3-like dinuclear metal center hexameric protein, partial [Actinomycetes bacterium]
MTLRVAEVAAALDALYPPALAEDWDVVGLTVGARDAAVTSVLYTVDCTLAVVREALELGCNLVVAHHPLLLRPRSRIDLDDPQGRVAGDLLRHGVALFVAHTNADVPPYGVAAALADRLGLTDTAPLRPHPTDPLDKVVTFVPTAHAAAVVDALAAAGAGRIGAYDRCAFLIPGTGTFRPLAGAQPFLGRAGRVETVTEDRVEMVARRVDRAQVVAALLAAHPYEEPAYDVLELASQPSAETGLGRVGALPTPLRLADFAAQVASAVPATGAGLRVAGDPDRVVQRVALLPGAGGDLLADVRTAGAEVYLTSDLRHHPASEALAWSDAPALVEVPHWAAEHPWLAVAQRQVAERLAEQGWAVSSWVSELCTDPWTFTV